MRKKKPIYSSVTADRIATFEWNRSPSYDPKATLYMEFKPDPSILDLMSKKKRDFLVGDCASAIAQCRMRRIPYYLSDAAKKQIIKYSGKEGRETV